MRFKPEFVTVNIDVSRYRREFDNKMTEIIKEAARSWLRTVLLIIPTWSRASRATFEALANEVGFNVTYGPLRAKKDRLLLGLSTSKGGLKIEKGKSYHFFYETDLRYLAYNNVNRVIVGQAPNVFAGLINPTPYRFTDAGQKDFESFAQNNVRLPNPYEFITRNKI